MQLNIKDAVTVALAKRVAAQRGTSMTAAVRAGLYAIAEETGLAGDLPTLTPEQQAIVDEVMAIAARTGPALRAAGVTMENYDEGVFDYLYQADFKG